MAETIDPAKDALNYLLKHKVEYNRNPVAFRAELDRFYQNLNDQQKSCFQYSLVCFYNFSKFDKEVEQGLESLLNSSTGDEESFREFSRKIDTRIETDKKYVKRVSKQVMTYLADSIKKDVGDDYLKRFIKGFINFCGKTEFDTEVKQEFKALKESKSSKILYYNLANLLEKVYPGEFMDKAVDIMDDDEDCDDRDYILKWEKLDLRWDDVIGLKNARKQIIKDIVLPQTNPKLAKYLNPDPSTLIILEGPHGTGKTTFAKVIASQIDAEMAIIDNLTAPYIGESEELIRGVFDEARARMQKTNKSTILFFDEFRRFVVSGNDGFSKAVIDEFKSELDGLNKNTYSVKGKTYRVFVIGTTNNIDDIDKGLLRPGRATVLNIPLPNKEERTEFFKRYLAEKYTIGDINYDKLAAMTEGLAGADIKIGIVGGTLADILMKRILGDDLNEKNISELKKINPKKDVRLRFDQATLEVAVTSYNPKKTEAPTNIYA